LTEVGVENMFLTKECDYGLRIVRALGDGEKKNAEKICKIEHIPSQYVYKTLKKLDKAGIVRSIRGRGGGYSLNMPLDSFSIYDVVYAVDEELFLNACLRPDEMCLRNSMEKPCVVHAELERIQSALSFEMKRNSIKEIVLSGEKTYSIG
jgi:Rrf2 family protein